MKKILIVFLMFICLFTITGCDNNSSSTTEENYTGHPTIKYKDQEVELSIETNFKDLHYRTNPDDLKTTVLNNLRVIEYEYNSEFVFEIRMAYVENATLKEATKSLSYPTEIKKLYNKEYTYGEWSIVDNTKGKLYAHQYFYEYNNTVYTICFFTTSNVSIYEDLFMKYVDFKSE